MSFGFRFCEYYRQVDSDNPIVNLCIRGIEREALGSFDEATRLYRAAWDQSSNDFERCIAAHYVARHQKNAVDALEWNRRSLFYADRADYQRVRGFYPSLHLNIGNAYEDLGDLDAAKRHYELAAAALDSIPEDAYGAVVRDSIARALKRVSSPIQDRSVS